MRRRRKKEWGKKQRVCQVLFVLSNPPPPHPLFLWTGALRQENSMFSFFTPFLREFCAREQHPASLRVEPFFFLFPSFV